MVIGLYSLVSFYFVCCRDKLLEEESVSTDDRNTETEEIILDDVDIAECLHHFTALEEIKDKLVCTSLRPCIHNYALLLSILF